MMFFTGKLCIFVVVELPSFKTIALLPEYHEMYFNMNGLWTLSWETSV